MLRPIPQRILRDMVTIKVCTGVDVWQKPVWQETLVKNVHLQNTNEVRKTALDYDALAMQSEAAGRPMRAVVMDFKGRRIGDYEVLVVDTGPNVPSTTTHHVELGLV